MTRNSPEKASRKVVDDCADCDVCRFLMDSDCLFFPELYRLYDKEVETGEKITSEELRELVNLCNFCALCPCPPVRTNIIEAKTRFIDRDGLKFGVRTLEDIERIAKICGVYPGLTNRLFHNKTTGNILKKTMGIHKTRQIPRFPSKSFPQWVEEQQLNAHPQKQQNKKVAYFAGCTANYLFPELPQTVVDIFQYNGFDVFYPKQKCCGMPSMLEGDRTLTLEFLRSNINNLAEAVMSGYDIVCSCPTCGFMLRHIIMEGAYYSPKYQASVSTEEAYIKIPQGRGTHNPSDKKFALLKKSIFQSILKDDGYLSTIDPMKRIAVAENTYDLGEYLINLHQSGDLQLAMREVSGRMVYFPPCHQREQNIGRPYLELLNLIPDINLESIDGSLYCCGMAGIMGFKQEFYGTTVQLGNRLMAKIKEFQPETIVTDCLSCRLQFRQLLPYKVQHPIEIISQAYFKQTSDTELLYDKTT